MSATSSRTVIACDESGNEGENLTRAGSRVFAHASVDLTVDEADTLMSEIRKMTGSSAGEIKSSLLLQPENRDVLEWFLAEQRLEGRTNVYLVEKDYFVCGKIVDLIVESHLYDRGHELYAYGRARDLAVTLYEQGPTQLTVDWNTALDQFNTMLRNKVRTGTKATLVDFYTTIDGLRPQAAGKLAHILRLIHAARDEAEKLIREMPATSPEYLALDPLFASLGATTRTWYEQKGFPVRVIHDQTSLLTNQRVETLRTGLAHADLPVQGIRPVILESLVQVDSKMDARVQIADLLAGAGRTIAEAALTGTPHDLTEKLRPHLDKSPNWGNAPSFLTLIGNSIPV